MKVVLTKHIYQDQTGIHCHFEVWGDSHEPGAEGVLFGSENLTLHSDHTPQQIADDIWSEAQRMKTSGQADWSLHNQIAPLIRQKEQEQSD